MATQSPNPVDVTEIQFKIHKKSDIFNPTGKLRSNVNLLAISSVHGLIFCGVPNLPEIRVIRQENLINTKEEDEELFIRTCPLPSVPNCIAISSDNSMLAVNYTINGSAFLVLYDVKTFLSNNIQERYNIRISGDENIQAKDILWNPVIPNVFAVLLDNGLLGMYTLKEGNSYEFFSTDKREQVQCVCWSPKGKQIVVGFQNGKLTQLKPDLKPARNIICPQNVHEPFNAPFNTIAIQWLSTYQFAVVFLSVIEESSPCLYIVNATKNANPVYIRYGDITYSSTGPRLHQIFLIHVQQWNLLLIASSNGLEAGLLGTREVGETPTWTQYITPDEARIEMPLTSNKEDTYPIGISLNTGCTHQVTIGENKVPVMPMVHVLVTHGFLISFNFLNLTQNTPGICCPPQNCSDITGLSQFVPASKIFQECVNSTNVENQMLQHEGRISQVSEISFGGITTASTPAPNKPNFEIDSKQKPLNATNLFGGTLQPSEGRKLSFGLSDFQGNSVSVLGQAANNVPAPTPSFGQLKDQPQQQTQGVNKTQPQNSFAFGTGGTQLSFGQPPTNSNNSTVFAPKPSCAELKFGQQTGNTIGGIGQPLTQSKSISFGNQNQAPIVVAPGSDKSKPLYTVFPTFSNASKQQQQTGKGTKSPQLEAKPVERLSSDTELNKIIKQITMTQIQSFEIALNELSEKSKDINISIGDIDKFREITSKKLADLQELSDLANERGRENEIQSLRHSLSECFGIIGEVKNKLNHYKSPELNDVIAKTNLNQTNRRQLAKLHCLLTTNEAQLKIVQKQIDAHWSNYQDVIHTNAQAKMRIPSLEGIYQTLLKHKEILSMQRLKLNHNKMKLGVKDYYSDKKKNQSVQKLDLNVNSLADSMLSLNLADQVKNENSRLTNDKLKTIRETLSNRNVIKIKAQRPDRIGLNSEIILEMRVKKDKPISTSVHQRDGAVTKPEKMEQQRILKPNETIMKPVVTKSVANPAIIQSIQGGIPILPKGTTIFPQQQVVFSLASSAPPTPNFVTTSNANTEMQKQKEKMFTQQQQVEKSPTIVAPTPAKAVDFKLPPGTTFTSKSVETNTVPNLFSTFGTGSTLNALPSFASSKIPTNSVTPTSDERQNIFSSATISTQNKVDDTVKPAFPFSFGMGSGNSNFSFTSNQQQRQQEPPKAQGQFAFAPKPIDKVSSTSETSLTKDDTTTEIKDANPEDKQQKEKGMENVKENTIFGGATNTSFTFQIGKNGDGKKLPATNLFASLNKFVEDQKQSGTVKGPSELAISNKGENKSSSEIEISNQSTFVHPATTNAFDTANALQSLITATTTTESSIPAFTFSSNSTEQGNGNSSVPKFGNTSSSLSSAANGSSPIADSSLLKSTAEVTNVVKPSQEQKDTTDLFGSLNLCKPTTSGNEKTQGGSGNIFTGDFSFASSTPDTKAIFGVSPTDVITDVKSTLNVTAPTSSVTTTVPAAISTTSNAPSSNLIISTTSSIPSTTTSLPAASQASSIAISRPENLASNASIGLNFGSISTPATTLSFGSVTGPASNSNSLLTSPFNVPANATTAGTNTSIFSNAAATVAKPLFGVTATSTVNAPTFGTPATNSGTLFGGVASFTSTSSSPPIFSNVPTTSTTLFGGASTVVSTASEVSLFGGIPKPDQSVFASVATTGSDLSSPFQSATFGGATVQSPTGGNLFGTQTNSTVFGTPAQNTGSIFGGNASGTDNTTTNLFGTPPNQMAPGGSLFGGTSFASGTSTGPDQQSGGSIFGGNNVFGGGANFGQTNSPFAGGNNTIFGGGGTQNSSFTTPLFGGGGTQTANQPFGSTSPGGSFVQGGPSIAQTGFGSPGSSNTGNIFGAKPTFGGPPSFGGNATFGATPSFGGSPTFGNSPAFGSGSSGAFSPPSQKNNLFETLGSSDTGLSFGNLAQNANMNNPKTQFGGSSFSTWR